MGQYAKTTILNKTVVVMFFSQNGLNSKVIAATSAMAVLLFLLRLKTV